MGGLPSPAEAEEIWDDLWHQEAHHSTALEGDALILNEVRKPLDEGRAVGSKELGSIWRSSATEQPRRGVWNVAAGSAQPVTRPEGRRA